MSLHSYRDLLQEYFDEGLDTVHEEVLFSELGRNGELRLEFSRMMRMHKTVQADAVHIRAPLAADDVFRRIVAPLPEAPGAARLLMRRVGAFAATAVLAILATTAVFLMYDNDASEVGASGAVASAASAVHHRESPLPVDKPTAINPVDVSTVDVSAVAQESIDAVRTTAVMRSSLPVADNGEISTSAMPEHNVLSAEFKSTPVLLDTDYSEVPIQANSRAALLRILPLEYEDGTVSLSLRGIGSGDVSTRISDHISAGVWYEFDGTHALGVEAGQEPFQSVSEVEVDGETVEFRSTETLPWAMAVYRLSLPEVGIERTVYPFAQLGAGVARSGAIGKAQLGLVLQPEHRVLFSLGVESTMLFRSGDTPLSTLRWTYGVGIKL